MSASLSQETLKNIDKDFQNGNFANARVLFETKVIPFNFVDKDKRTALHWFSSKGNDEAVTFLLQNGCPLTPDNAGWTPLHCAASAGHLGAVVQLVEIGHSDVNALNDRKSSPLDYACSKGKKDIVLYLLSHGAKFNTKDSNGTTALHRSVASNSVEVVRLLLKQPNIMIESRTTAQETPLHLAVLENNAEITQALLQAGADPNVENEDGETPVFLARKKKDKDLLACFENAQK